jgi:GT2 family glycosyltransferase
MEGISIIVPVFNKIETTVKCIDAIRQRNAGSSFEIIIVDNGSTDETREVFTLRAGLKPAPTYIRNSENLGVAKAFNIGADAAKYDIFCFMHNDVFIFKDHWIAALQDFIVRIPNAGVVGLYGAKTLRKDGSFRGKTIVHAKKNNPAIHGSFEKVAVVDGLLMTMKKTAFKKTGGFCEDFGVHYYDKDISMRAMKSGFDNYILSIPFEHECNTTRSQINKDDLVRDAARNKFTGMWKGFLPADVTTLRERIGYLFHKAES